MAIPILFYAGGKMPAYIEDLRVVIPRILEYNEDDNGHFAREEAAICAAALRVPIPEGSKNVNTEYGTGLVLPRPAGGASGSVINGLLATGWWLHVVMTDREVLYPAHREWFPILARFDAQEAPEDFFSSLGEAGTRFCDDVAVGTPDTLSTFMRVWRRVQVMRCVCR